MRQPPRPGLAGPVLRMTVFVGCELWHHRPVVHEIVRRAHRAGMAGTSVFPSIEGFGRSARIHGLGRLRLAEGTGYLVMVVDTEQRVFLQNGNLGLNPPLHWSVYGQPFSIEQ